MSKIIVDTIESTGTTVTVNDGLASGAINAGTNAITAGSVTGLTATSITSGTLPNAQLADGHILQVVTGELTTIQSSTAAGWNDIPSLTCSITPADTSNKILITIAVGGLSQYNGNTPALRVLRGTTVCTVNDHSGYGNLARGVTISPGYSNGTENAAAASACFFDSPSTTSATTYKVQWYGRPSGSFTNTINAFYAWDNHDYYAASISSLVVMELKA